MNLPSIYQHLQNRVRLSPEEGLFLLRNGDLLDLGAAANDIRYRKNPQSQISFVVDTNPNYSNVCEIDCIFCAFYRHRNDDGVYTYTIDQMIGKFKAAAAQGVTTILLQGGVHPDLPFSYYIEMVERTVKEVPEVTPHFYSTSEIIGMANISGLTVPQVLQKLWDAGQRTIPGGGAEILSDRVKKKISHLKGTSADWLNVMREAQKIGFKDRKSVV
jgi:cyclic dehypoxanthinyl futalosine synthase